MIIKETLTINDVEYIHRYSSTGRQIKYNDGYYTDITQKASTAGTDDDYIEAPQEPDTILTDEFWNVFQKNGERTDYSYAFANWEHSKLVPLHQLVGTAFLYLLLNSTIEDASEIVVKNTSQNPSMQGVCMNCVNMLYPPRFIFTNASFVRTWTSAFAGCKSMTECEIDFGSKQIQIINPITTRNNMQNTFFDCSALTSVIFKGKGSPKNLDLSPCINLSVASVISLAESLYDVSSATEGDYTIKLSNGTIHAVQQYEANNDESILSQFEDLGWNIEAVNNVEINDDRGVLER